MKTKYFKKCYEMGHDWAFQDCDRFILKVCLRCGAETFFFPYEENQELEE